MQARIASLGGKARARSLSPERRCEIARWARFNREQKAQGQITATEQMERTIKLVRVENPDLAAFLKAISRMPFKYAERVTLVLSDDEKRLIEIAFEGQR